MKTEIFDREPAINEPADTETRPGVGGKEHGENEHGFEAWGENGYETEDGFAAWEEKASEDAGTLEAWDENDPPPEYCHYRDEGCELAASCLSCPFSRCIYDEPGGKQHFVKTLRDREIGRLYRDGKGVNELAAMFSVSQRTIHRALKRVENERNV